MEDIKHYKQADWLSLVMIWLLVSGLSGIAHEAGHFFSAYIFDLEPTISFLDGGFVSHDKDLAISLHQEALIIALGPLFTFLLAILAYVLWKRKRDCIIFLFFALFNSIFRFNMLFDGAGSDEWKLATLLNLPVFTFTGISFFLSIALLTLILKKIPQLTLKNSMWLLPTFWMLGIVGYRLSFGFVGLLAG